MSNWNIFIFKGSLQRLWHSKWFGLFFRNTWCEPVSASPPSNLSPSTVSLPLKWSTRSPISPPQASKYGTLRSSRSQDTRLSPGSGTLLSRETIKSGLNKTFKSDPLWNKKSEVTKGETTVSFITVKNAWILRRKIQMYFILWIINIRVSTIP